MRSRLAVALALAVALPVALASAPAPSGGWSPADPAHRWSFPRDHHAHSATRNEWWYFTGIVSATGAPGRRFGYQLTLFRVGLVPDPPALDSAWATGTAVMGHAAITDLSTGAHVFSEVVWRAAPPLGGFGAADDPVVAFARAPPGTPGRWTVALDGAGGFAVAMRDDARGVALELSLRPEKPVALQGPNGYSRKSALPGYASLYYSLTRLSTSGRLTASGETFPVSGASWMDRELGSSQLAPGQRGWDWWSLRLADGRDLMLYVLRRPDGAADWRNGTLVGKDGAVTVLAADAWSVEATGTWRSPETGAAYPSGWRVRVPGAGVDLTVTPIVKGAENVSRLVDGLAYWEGPVTLAAGGADAGEGYVELTGYGPAGRLPL
ncbi:lipocalin-like domain-containing protein [Anaeromyxobacter oryzae]|uniref:Carotenoid 1,2-hydratase n=1 Tax=Anaeromyxobacter oryzae TaxID=2918170 RepID=A0ABM7WNH6_9BACT|nr:lipocalin-like domain-containing protein [Anaeromyxobacter oryzae]BDG01018.1 carotenoid 1,2-hydratase [Anaeromyxobacter oryzae]